MSLLPKYIARSLLWLRKTILLPQKHISRCLHWLLARMSSSTVPAELNNQKTGNGKSYLLDRDLDNAPPFASYAKGNYIYLASGSKVMDSSGGAAVSGLGHAVECAINAFHTQAKKVEYCHSGLVSTQVCHDLSEFICKSTNGKLEKAYFCSSGIILPPSR